MASEYGWSKSVILNEVYPDEVNLLMKQIQRRQAGKRLFALQASIYPHIKKESARQITSQLEKIMDSDISEDRLDDKFDMVAFQKVKKMMGQKRWH